jgi:NAD(P)-dependent dehydrogenase (short-subunit alcohol dehydrogenase family)
MNFTGRVAAVTGGGSGIGEACARALAAGGAKVAVIDLRAEDAQRVANEIGGLAVTADICDGDTIERAAQTIVDTFGPVDVLVASAGVAQPARPPESLRQTTWDRIIAVDLRGTYLTCVAFGTRMARQGRGSIVNIASVAGCAGTPLHAYGPAKAGVISMTTNLAVEWGRSGVRVNAVSPSHTLTPYVKNAIETGTRDPLELSENTALGRIITPEEVAMAVLFLASDAASAITGINLPVDAGWLAVGGWHSYGGVRPAREHG